MYEENKLENPEPYLPSSIVTKFLHLDALWCCTRATAIP
eukprot:SAG22_NODE_15305_length_352_cov_0.612648_1_plen_38_part_10